MGTGRSIFVRENVSELLHPKTSAEIYFQIFQVFFTVIPIIFSSAASTLITNALPKQDSYIKQFVIEFVIIIFPLILLVTVANKILVTIAVITFLIYGYMIIKKFIDIGNKKSTLYFGKRPKGLTMIRSSINAFTSICILAVDFRIFPVNFMKTNTFGVGLMDTGIGLFVFSMGVVSQPIRNESDVKKLMKTVAPLLVMGLIRTYVLLLIGYKQDEIEYGKHWNAFFTLGVVKLFGSILTNWVPSNKTLIPLSIMILIVHDIALQLGLTEFVMDARTKRETLFRANREGICSLPGFIALYLLAYYVGSILRSNKPIGWKDLFSRLKKIGCVALISWIALLWLVPLTGISRRVANSGYVVWMLSLSTTMLILNTIMYDHFFQAYWKKKSVKEHRQNLPSLIEAINYNGLVFFVISNVLTGAVNIFLKPNMQNTGISILILCGYMLISIYFVCFMFSKKLKIG